MSEPTVSWGAGLTPDELAARIKAHPFAAVRESLMQKITLTVLRHSQQRTPVRFGHLRRSETTRVEPGGLRGWVGTNVRYAPFVHEGTRFMAARPFFEQGMQDSRGEIDRLLQESGDEYFASII